MKDGRTQRRDQGRASLEAAWRADAEERPHPKAEIEGAGMNEQPLERVLVSAHMHAPEPTGLIEVSAWSFQQFPAFPEEPRPLVTVLWTFIDDTMAAIGRQRRDPVRPDRQSIRIVLVGSVA